MGWIFLKEKAYLLSAIIVISMFSVYLMNPASAQEQENLACCERTNSAEPCRYTQKSNCDPAYDIREFQTCEESDICKTGCCIAPDGSCSKQVSKGTCEALEGYTFDPDANCNIPKCSKGCCVLGGAACLYSTEKKCNSVLQEYPELTKDYRPIGSEQECTDVCRAVDKGCCVRDDGTCKYEARGTCTLQDGTGSTGFYNEVFCANDALDQNCGQCVANQGGKACVEGSEDVYWFDSCGNQEDVAQNCDYGAGDLCSGADEDSDEAYCKSINCDLSELTDYENIDYDVERGRKNGESWCIYDAAVGPARDLPGSRHFRNLCLNGEEIVEPCKDFREEACWYVDIINVGRNGDYSEGSCLQNNWKDCSTTCNTAKDARDKEEKKLKMKADEQCCNSPGRTCGWAWADDEHTDGFCYQVIPAGGKFWAEDNSQQAQSQSELAQRCSIATNECSTSWEWNLNTGYDWECVRNCHCYNKKYLDFMSIKCGSLGDCGAKYNYLGEYTNDGFFRMWTGDWKGWDGKDPEDSREPLEEMSETDLPEGMEYQPNPGQGLYLGQIDYKQFTGPTAIQSIKRESYELTGNDYILSGGAAVGAGAIAGTSAAIGASVGAASLASAAAAQGATATTAAFVASSSAAYTTGAAATAGAASGASSGALAGTGIGAVIALAFAAYFVAEGDYRSATLVVGSAAAGVAVAAVLGATGAITFLAPMAALVPWGTLVAAVIAIVLLALSLSGDSEKRSVTVSCLPWQSPLGGEDCNKCDESEKKPCSEYRCRSLGATCKFIKENEGTRKGTCYNADPNDVTRPIINGWDETLQITSNRKDITNKYTVHDLREGGLEGGYELIGKIPSFSRITFGIETSELSQCRLGEELKNTYNELTLPFPDTYFDYHHNITIAPLLPNKTYEYYVICRDPSGNPKEDGKTAPFKIQFETDDGPDLEPPLIIATDIANNGKIRADANAFNLGLYVDEVSQFTCKYSTQDKDYNLMEKNATCAAAPVGGVFSGYSVCFANLSITGEEPNTYYFRCADAPVNAAGEKLDSNVNSGSFIFTATKSKPLKITQASPQGQTIYSREVTMQVKTAEGAENGIAVCYYEVPGFTAQFFTTNQTSGIHEQKFIGLPRGFYNFVTSCFDYVGNAAYDNINFTIDVDLDAPIITGLYTSGSSVTLNFNEATTCQYFNSTFNYGQGKLAGTGQMQHTLSGLEKYYVICEDAFNNRMQEAVIVPPVQATQPIA